MESCNSFFFFFKRSRYFTFVFAILTLLAFSFSFQFAYADDSTPIIFNNADLEEAVKNRLKIAESQPVTEGDMKRLTDLAVFGKLSNDDISALKYAVNLTKLSITDVKISDLRPLANLTKLEDLRVTHTQIGDLAPLAQLTKLTSLDLSFNEHISDISPLAGLTELHELDLSGAQVTDIHSLANLTKLRHLDLRGNLISDINPLAGLTELKVLNLWNGEPSDFRPLANLTKLEELTLSLYRTRDLSPLAGLTKLTALYLNGFAEPVDISPLASLTELETLSAYAIQISDLAPLVKLTKLNDLQLSFDQISDISLLAGLTELKNVRLDENQISDFRPLSYEKMGLNGSIRLQHIVREIPELTSKNPSYELSFTFYNSTGASTAVEEFEPVSENGLTVTKKDDSTFVITWDKQTLLRGNKEYKIARNASEGHELFIRFPKDVSRVDTSEDNEAHNHSGDVLRNGDGESSHKEGGEGGGTSLQRESSDKPLNLNSSDVLPVSSGELPQTGETYPFSVLFGVWGLLISTAGLFAFCCKIRSR